MKFFSAAFLVSLSLPISAVAEDFTFTGRPSVIDGDTLEITGQRIRLGGIDAPESGQRCYDAHVRPYRCGRLSAFFLADNLIGSNIVTCSGTKYDRYKRLIARCVVLNSAGTVDGPKDINRSMVSAGWAVAYRKYSTDYIAHEQQAHVAKKGIWVGSFVMPWDWRKGVR